ncbi:MAG: hypothetical protein WBV22_01010 [Anaerolineaceae bacterium]
MPPFAEIILAHLKRYPLMEVQDLYKLTYQAALGAEHAALNQDAVHNYLMQELSGLVEGPEEPPAEPISPDGRILRVHLRPFIKTLGDPLKLSRAFWESSQAYRGTTDLLLEYWQAALNLAQTGQLPFNPKKMEDYFTDRKIGEFQPVHHSTAYREAYHPAYRIIEEKYYKAIINA